MKREIPEDVYFKAINSLDTTLRQLYNMEEYLDTIELPPKVAETFGSKLIELQFTVEGALDKLMEYDDEQG